MRAPRGGHIWKEETVPRSANVFSSLHLKTENCTVLWWKEAHNIGVISGWWMQKPNVKQCPGIALQLQINHPGITSQFARDLYMCRQKQLISWRFSSTNGTTRNMYWRCNADCAQWLGIQSSDWCRARNKTNTTYKPNANRYWVSQWTGRINVSAWSVLGNWGKWCSIY